MCVTGELNVKYQKFVKTGCVYICESRIEKEEKKILHLSGHLKDFENAFEDGVSNCIGNLVMVKLEKERFISRL